MEELNETVEKWQELMEKGHYVQLREELNEENPANVAEFLEELPADKQLFLFRLLSKDMAAEAFSFLDNDTQEMLVTSITAWIRKPSIPVMSLTDNESLSALYLCGH